MVINKELYHKDYDGELILDKDGEPIPLTFCICAAHNEFDCCCDCPWGDEEYKKLLDMLESEE